jgi:pantoate--beta-alanine ligase
MIVVTTLDELRQARAQFSGPVGFVPTMGFLHAGHVSLARCAREECASVVASIFVNPTQFGPTEDLAKYPRDLPRDQALLAAAGVDLLWTPTSEVIYPPGFQSWVTVDGLTSPLEGGQRPGHFRGVTTVVAKLFNAVGPDKAYFGQKDAQQAAVIRRMTRDLDFPIQIVVCPTVREADGLAMSSRNAYLSADQRRQAVALSEALALARDLIAREHPAASAVVAAMRAHLARRAPDGRIDYVAVVDPQELSDVAGTDRPVLVALAVKFGRARLIDNVLVEP